MELMKCTKHLAQHQGWDFVLCLLDHPIPVPTNSCSIFQIFQNGTQELNKGVKHLEERILVHSCWCARAVVRTSGEKRWDYMPPFCSLGPGTYQGLNLPWHKAVLTCNSWYRPPRSCFTGQCMVCCSAPSSSDTSSPQPGMPPIPGQNCRNVNALWGLLVNCCWGCKSLRATIFLMLMFLIKWGLLAELYFIFLFPS